MKQVNIGFGVLNKLTTTEIPMQMGLLDEVDEVSTQFSFYSNVLLKRALENLYLDRLIHPRIWKK